MILVDTGPFVARWLARDLLHSDAVASWDALSATPTSLLTTCHVVDEVATLLARRAGPGFAAARVRSIMASRVITVARPDQTTEYQALEWLERFDDQGFSFTDCISFAVMRATGVREAFAYDQHFRIAGFQVITPGAGE